MRENRVYGISPQGFHQVYYTEWGDASNPDVIICVHGMTRNSRDFDWLAQKLSTKYRVVCPDLIGRGQSSWLSSPIHYNFPQYIQDCNAIFARLNVKNMHWIGFSLGGLIGMIMASLPQSPIRSLLMNDVGPYISQNALQAIQQYTENPPSFPTETEAREYICKIYQGFLSYDMPEYWDHLFKTSYTLKDGMFIAKYDPAIAVGLAAMAQQDLDMWSYWEQISCPTMIFRGALSELLTTQTLETMKKKKPATKSIVFPGLGHAPSLAEPNQIEAIEAWLESCRRF